jgi:hypothetical protein
MGCKAQSGAPVAAGRTTRAGPSGDTLKKWCPVQCGKGGSMPLVRPGIGPQRARCGWSTSRKRLASPASLMMLTRAASSTSTGSWGLDGLCEFASLVVSTLSLVTVSSRNTRGA